MAGKKAVLAFEGKGFIPPFLQTFQAQPSTPGRSQWKEWTVGLRTQSGCQGPLLCCYP